MKKNVLKKILFTLMVIIVGGFTSVAADTLPVIVNGTSLTDETNTMTLGEGTLTYNKETKELILDNVTITSDTNYGINLVSTEDEVKIILKGDNKIIVTSTNFGIRSSNDIVITGDGKLTITAEFPTIQGKNITIDGAKLDLTTTGVDLAAIENNNLLVIKNNAKVKAKGYGAALSSFGKMEVTNSELDLEATRDSSNAIYVEATNADGTLSITNSKIKAKSGYACVFSAGDMKLSNSNFNLESIAGGIYSNTSVSIDNSKVYVSDGNYGVGVGQGVITINNSNFEINVNNVAFMHNPIINGFDNKIIYAGYEKDGTDAEIVTINDELDLSEYQYVKIISKYNITIIPDENIVLEGDNELTALEGENKEITITAKEGYKIKSVLVNDEEVKLNDNKLSLINIDKNVIVKITSEEMPKTANEINNPKTGDNIVFYIIVSIISIVGLIIISKFKNKLEEK